MDTSQMLYILNRILGLLEEINVTDDESDRNLARIKNQIIELRRMCNAQT